MTDTVENTQAEEATAAVAKSLDEMSLTELVAEYNRQAEEKESNHTDLKPLRIKRIKVFKDRKTGIRRINELTGVTQPAPRKAAAETETTVKKPIKKAAVKKAKTTPKAKPAAKRTKGEGLAQEFGFTAGGEREKLLLILSGRNMGKQVPRSEFGGVAHMIGKINLRIKRKKLKYKLVKEKTDDGVTYGLYPK